MPPQIPDCSLGLLDRSSSTSVAGLSAAERAEQVALARGIAFAAYTGATDKIGVDYIRHPEAVAARFDAVTQTLEHCAGWLHDVVEDTEVDAGRLEAAGIHPEIIEIVTLLTRVKDAGDEYYARIAAHPAARRVKLSDLAHNTDPDRVAWLEDADRVRLREKYGHALELLGADWGDLDALRG